MTAIAVSPFLAVRTVAAFARYLLGALFALVAIIAHATAGQPGTLDPFWANGSALGSGKLITAVGPRNDYAASIVVQPDGKVLVSGFCNNTGLCAVRYNSNGSLDAGFGNAGVLPQPASVAGASSAFVAPLADGRLLLAGSCAGVSDRDFCLFRFGADGIQDAGFGVDGVVRTSVGPGDDDVRALLVQPDGKIVLTGHCNIDGGNNVDFCAARFLANGQLDSSFGGTGKVITAFSNREDSVNAAVLQPDGKLVLTGYCADVAGVEQVCALRYAINGTLDAGFGSAGRLVTAVGTGFSVATSLALQPDGKLLIAASCLNGITLQFCALRYASNGTLDTSFGSAGIVTTAIGTSNDSATTIALQPDGKLLLAGNCVVSGQFDFCAARYTAAGVLDATFGTGGKLITAISNGATPATSNDVVNAIALQPDGKLLLAGSCRSGSFDKFCVARYDGGPFPAPACSLDIDGDTQVLATTDSLIHARIALGIRGDAVVAGINFPINAQRKTWAQIRGHLVSMCGMMLPL